MLPGAFMLVARFGADTILIGDRAGRVRVYFTTVEQGGVERGILCGTEAKRLAAYRRSGPLLDVLALELAVSGIERYGDRVPLGGVAVVPPGWLLRIGPGGHRLERWDDASRTASFALTAEGVEPAMVADVAHIAEHANGLSGDVSGGLDSRTLIRLASWHASLDAITYADFPDSDDVRYAREFAASANPPVRHHVIARSPRTLDYSGLGDLASLPVTDLPSCDVVELASHRAIFELAASLGSTDHMLGVGADQVLAARPSKLIGLMRVSRRRAVVEAVLLARQRRASAGAVLAALRRVHDMSYRESLLRVARAIEAGEVDALDPRDAWREDLTWCMPTAAAGWLTADAAHLVGEHLRRLAETPPVYPDAEAAREWQEVRRFAANFAGFRDTAADLGLELHMPYLHAQLLDCLRLPGHVREPRGSSKPLVRQAMADTLGPALATPTTHGTLVNTNQLGLREHRQSLRELVACSVLVREGIFKASAVRHAMERSIAGIGGRTLWIAPFAATEVWLAQLDLRHSAWWKEER
jgi:asparagine synthase (glutamine-hydrolysing)